MLQNLTHALLDGARMGSWMSEAQKLNEKHLPLYVGVQGGALAGLSPVLFSFNSASTFGSWCLHSGWGASWGVLLKSSLPMHELQQHFRKFLKVQTESGKSLFFRYYDPRVLRIFLPTCTGAQLHEFFGEGIEYFLVEDEDPAFAICFRVAGGQLKQERIQVAPLISALPVAITPGQQLAPETIEALKQMGMLERVLELLGETPTSTQPAADAPTASPAAPPQPTRAPEKAQPTPAQTQPTPKKSKWNMFD